MDWIIASAASAPSIAGSSSGHQPGVPWGPMETEWSIERRREGSTAVSNAGSVPDRFCRGPPCNKQRTGGKIATRSGLTMVLRDDCFTVIGLTE